MQYGCITFLRLKTPAATRKERKSIRGIMLHTRLVVNSPCAGELHVLSYTVPRYISLIIPKWGRRDGKGPISDGLCILTGSANQATRVPRSPPGAFYPSCNCQLGLQPLFRYMVASTRYYVLHTYMHHEFRRYLHMYIHVTTAFEASSLRRSINDSYQVHCLLCRPWAL